MKFYPINIFLSLCLFTGITLAYTSSTPNKEYKVTKISAEKAKLLIDTADDYVILDVRTKSEYDSEHIPNAQLLPDYKIKKNAEYVLSKKDQLILVYCRSGRRSAQAAKTLAEMGYSQIYDFGGIIDWPYETISATME